MDLILTPSSPLLGKRIANELRIKFSPVTYKRFPDGELYVRVESPESQHIVVCSINSSEDFVLLNLLFDAIKGEIIAVIPYMGYARQDREFLKGEAVSIRAIAKILEERVEKIITVNIHSEKAKENFRKLEDVDAMPLLGEKFKNDDVVMISPDKGSAERVKIAAKFANCDWDWLEKRRVDAQTVEINPKSVEVKDRRVLIVDDIISTGGTVVEAAKKLYELGAKSVECACIHAILADFAAIKLFSNGIQNIVATDTVEKIFSKITVSKILAEKIRELTQ